MLETAYSSTLSSGINKTVTTIGVAAAPLSVTKGIMLIGEGNKKEWISFTGVSSLNLTGVTRGLDKNASSITDNTTADQPALSHLSGTKIRLIASHLDIMDLDGDNTVSGSNTYSGDNTWSGTNTYTGTTKALMVLQNVTTTQRDALTSVANGTPIYNTTLGQMEWREGGAWVTNAVGGTVADASTTVAGKFEEATVAEQGTATATGSTGARLVPANANIVKTSSGSGDENKILILGSDGKLAAGFIPTLTDTRNTIPSGAIMMWSTGTPPTDWLECDDSAVSRTTYSALFAVIGTTYGVGDGSTTFNLPDFRGRIPIGVGTGDASDATAHALADKEGKEKHTLTVAELAAHTHNFQYGNSGGSGVVDYGSNAVDINRATSSTGSNTAHNNLQPSLTITFIIKT